MTQQYDMISAAFAALSWLNTMITWESHLGPFLKSVSNQADAQIFCSRNRPHGCKFIASDENFADSYYAGPLVNAVGIVCLEYTQPRCPLLTIFFT